MVLELCPRTPPTSSDNLTRLASLAIIAIRYYIGKIGEKRFSVIATTVHTMHREEPRYPNLGGPAWKDRWLQALLVRPLHRVIITWSEEEYTFAHPYSYQPSRCVPI